MIKENTFCTTECWDCEDRTCEHYIEKSKLYFKCRQQEEEIKKIKESMCKEISLYR